MAQRGSAWTLEQLGWNAFFADQLGAAPAAAGVVPARVLAIQRRGLTVGFAGGETVVPLGGRWYQWPPESRPTIGDWVLLARDPGRDRGAIERLLARSSLLQRVAAGRPHEVQLIAANVDTMFLVSSCNEDFNLSRMERYLALALNAGVRPVVVLTKADLLADTTPLVAAVRTLMPELAVELVDARDERTLAGVRVWCQPGETVALLGSSGVGKSTLVNSLSGATVQLTQGIREDDAKGRHTTTHRSVHRLPDGGLLVDNPGMRELSLVGVEQGVQALFDDIERLAGRCRFRDCRHEAEPGCAVRAALEAGELEPRRLDSFRKLLHGPAGVADPTAERHARARALARKSRQPREPGKPRKR